MSIKKNFDCNNNSEAARQFNMNELTIRKWIKNKRVLMKLNPKKRALRSGKPKWPELEKRVKECFGNEKTEITSFNFRHYI